MDILKIIQYNCIFAVIKKYQVLCNGEEDEYITEKVKAYNLNIKENNKKEQQELTINEDLTKELKLIIINKLSLTITYDKAKKIIVYNKINSKKEYYELCERDNRLCKEPETIFTQFKSWIDYLSIPRKYYNFNTCQVKINEYFIKYPKIKNVIDFELIKNLLCNIDKLFPPNDLWCDYYDIKKLENIINISIIKKKLIKK